MPKFAANLSMLFTEVDFLSRFEKAKNAGFKGVEYLLPYDYPVEDVVEALQSNGLTQVLFNLPSGDMPNGERGIACLPDRIDEFRQGVDQAITYAKALNCPQLNCLAGKVPEGLSHSEAHQLFVDNLRFAADKLAAENITLLVEMINTKDVPGFFLTTTAQALSILEEVNHPNIKIQYDIYHMQRMEGELANTMKANIDNIKHMQLADNPGRHEPGTGEINYSFLFDFIDQLPYDGWIGCEYAPAAGTEEGLGWLKDYL
jgi:hydroxypyruvate isomerase